MSFNLLYISHSFDALLGSRLYSANIFATGSNWLFFFLYSKCVRLYFGMNKWRKKKRSRKTSKFKRFLNRSCDLFSSLDVCARARYCIAVNIFVEPFLDYLHHFCFVFLFVSLQTHTHTHLNMHGIDLVMHCTLNVIVLSAKIWSVLLGSFIILIQTENKSFLQTMKNETLWNMLNERKFKNQIKLKKKNNLVFLMASE